MIPRQVSVSLFSDHQPVTDEENLEPIGPLGLDEDDSRFSLEEFDDQAWIGDISYDDNVTYVTYADLHSAVLNTERIMRELTNEAKEMKLFESGTPEEIKLFEYVLSGLQNIKKFVEDESFSALLDEVVGDEFPGC